MSTDLRTGTEKMFYEELGKLGAKIEAFIVRGPRDWFPDLYGFKITRADGSIHVGHTEWDVGTYARVLTIAKGE
ncbi:MAG: hypothetical protein ABFD96_06035 [Armatimonadia bacterium]